MAGADQEVEALWVSVFGEPPAVAGDAPLILSILVRCLPLAPPYGAAARPADDDPRAAALSSTGALRT